MRVGTGFSSWVGGTGSSEVSPTKIVNKLSTRLVLGVTLGNTTIYCVSGGDSSVFSILVTPVKGRGRDPVHYRETGVF